MGGEYPIRNVRFGSLADMAASNLTSDLLKADIDGCGGMSPSAKADIASLMGSSGRLSFAILFCLSYFNGEGRELIIVTTRICWQIRPLCEHFWLEAGRPKHRRQWPGSPPKFVRREPQ